MGSLFYFVSFLAVFIGGGLRFDRCFVRFFGGFFLGRMGNGGWRLWRDKFRGGESV